MADLLSRLLNVDPTVLAGAVWAASSEEIDPRSSMGDILSNIDQPPLPNGWRYCWLVALAWCPGDPPTAWTPAPVAIVQDAVRALDYSWPCPGFPPSAIPIGDGRVFMGSSPSKPKTHTGMILKGAL